jgi:putative endonuclease
MFIIKGGDWFVPKLRDQVGPLVKPQQLLGFSFIMAYCYIIYSTNLNKYYIGQTLDFENRLIQHNDGTYAHSFTKKVNDWEPFVLIKCDDKTHAIKVESFIKRMKSRIFIEKLKSNPVIIQDILNKCL